MRYGRTFVSALALGALSVLCSFSATAHAQDKVMGQIRFETSSKVLSTSGVWVDGEYIGYVHELRGGNRLRLLPGEHEIVIRQVGYADYDRKLMIEPGAILEITVNMDKDPRFVYPNPKDSAEVRFDVQPGRAAIFVDDSFAGYVDEYYGLSRAMVLSPGKHRFKIALPGYRTFETELNLVPRQKVALRTELVKGSILDADPSVRSESARTNSAADPPTEPALR